MNKNKPIVKKGKGNNTIVFNLSKFYSEKGENHYEFEELTMLPAGEKQHFFLSPRDVYLEPAGLLSWKPKGADELDKQYQILVEEGTCAEIFDTTHRRIKILLPISIKDIPEGLNNTILGDALHVAFMMRQRAYKIAEISLKEGINAEQLVNYAISGESNDIVQNRTVEMAKRLMQTQQSGTQMLTDKSKEEQNNQQQGVN